jgi:hypothetical protein
MTTPRRREQCLRNRAKKDYFKALRARWRRNGPSGVAGNTVDRTGPNLAGRGRLVYTATWNWSGKTEIPLYNTEVVSECSGTILAERI